MVFSVPGGAKEDKSLEPSALLGLRESRTYWWQTESCGGSGTWTGGFQGEQAHVPSKQRRRCFLIKLMSSF